VFAGPTAGYLISLPIAAFVVGLLTERFWARYNLGLAILANVVGGILVIYAIGVPVLAAVADLSPKAAIVSGALPFLIGDAIKAVLAAVIAVQVRRSYPVIERPQRAATLR
jgi:biotin transport system substrate-specific component